MSWLTRLIPVREARDAGERGEALAAKWLREHGYRILHRNLKVQDDEADLVALDPDGRTMVIVEVKCRTEDGTPPEAWVNARKQYFLTRLASKLVKRREFADHPIRFDVIAVVLRDGAEPELRHIPGAFESRW
jgi:putative endonuclease